MKALCVTIVIMLLLSITHEGAQGLPEEEGRSNCNVYTETFFFREIGKFSQSGLSLLFLSGFETFPSFFSLLLPCQNINGKAGPKMPWPHKQAKLQWQTHLFKRFQK
jgi:hypothetical protein